MFALMMICHNHTHTHESSPADVAQADAASPMPCMTDPCFADDQSVPRRRQDTTTLRRSPGSAHGKQRGHVVQADHHCAALRMIVLPDITA